MAKKIGNYGRVVSFYWEDSEGKPARELTAEVLHADGTTTFIVLPVDRLTDRISAKELAARTKRRDGHFLEPQL